MTSLSDIALVAQVAVLGNKRAFDQLVRRYQSPVRRFFLHQTLGNGQLSDDLAQDTFVKAYTSIGQFRGLASFSTWLMRIAYNVFYDYTRSLQHTAQGSQGADSPTVTARYVTDSASNASLRMDVYRALSLLKTEERSCIVLQLIDGRPIDEIAQIMHLPSNTVKSHLKRGKDKLTVYLKQNGYD